MTRHMRQVVVLVSGNVTSIASFRRLSVSSIEPGSANLAVSCIPPTSSDDRAHNLHRSPASVM